MSGCPIRSYLLSSNFLVESYPHPNCECLIVRKIVRERAREKHRERDRESAKERGGGSEREIEKERETEIVVAYR